MRRISHARSLLLLIAAAACSQSDGPTASVRLPSSILADVTPCANCVFGPETFTRDNGQPPRISRTFSATPGSAYTIDIDDLASQGADGRVMLNGQILMDTRAVTGEVGPRHITVDVTLLASNALEIRILGKKGSQLKVTITVKSDCLPNLPAPQLALEYAVAEVGGNRYELDVTNYASFPDALFAPAPDLEACGLNTSSSRTWVDIYGTDGINPANDTRIFGFCAFGQASDLNLAWFKIPTGSTPPEKAYITLTDRKCNLVYKSNAITLPTTIE
jgi:hypothetical protein